MNRRNLIALALLVSVAINLFFVGGIGFRMANVRDSREARPFPPNVGWIVRDLEDQRREELSALIRQNSDESRPLRQAMFNAQRKVNELMASTDFDAAALDQAFSELRAAGDRYQALSHQQTVNILAELTEEERRVAMEFVQRRGPRDGRDGFRNRDGGQRFRPGGPGGDFGGRPPADLNAPGPGSPPPPLQPN